jgi:hypothetical protein
MNFLMTRLPPKNARHVRDMMAAARFSSRTSPRRNEDCRTVEITDQWSQTGTRLDVRSARRRALPVLNVGDDESGAIRQTPDLAPRAGRGTRSTSVTIKLLADILRDSPVAVGHDQAAPGRPLDLGRWVLEELVVRRWEPIGWRRRPLKRRRLAPPHGDAAHGDPNWSETQPWCHE